MDAYVIANCNYSPVQGPISQTQGRMGGLKWQNIADVLCGYLLSITYNNSGRRPDFKPTYLILKQREYCFYLVVSYT